MSSILIITGPTAVGKTGLSLRLAEKYDVEIISADSRKVYRELTIGTAKPSPELLKAIPHHFINERSVFDEEPFSAGQFAEEAYERIEAITSRNRVPLVVGGSTLYIHALQYGLARIPEIPSRIRAKVEEQLSEKGEEALFAELQEVDPKAAATMDPTKTQRLVRALEVYCHTGHPISSFYDNIPTPPFNFTTIVLHRDRAELYQRINRRAEKQLARGLLHEVKGLLDRNVNTEKGPMRTLGYRETARHLRGGIPYAEMKRLLKRNTRRYAKRQLTWFRRYEEYEWVPAEEGRERLKKLFDRATSESGS